MYFVICDESIYGVPVETVTECPTKEEVQSVVESVYRHFQEYSGYEAVDEKEFFDIVKIIEGRNVEWNIKPRCDIF